MHVYNIVVQGAGGHKGETGEKVSISNHFVIVYRPSLYALLSNCNSTFYTRNELNPYHHHHHHQHHRNYTEFCNMGLIFYFSYPFIDFSPKLFIFIFSSPLLYGIRLEVVGAVPVCISTAERNLVHFQG